MKKILALISFASVLSASAQNKIDLSGTWEFQIQRSENTVTPISVYDDTIQLPGSMVTRSKGDIVSYSGKLYEAKADIGTAEDWKAAHWQEITIGATLTALNAAAATIPDNINDEAITLSTATANYLITVDDSGETPELEVTAIEEEAGD